MKIKKEHYEHMKQEISKLDKEKVASYKDSLKSDGRIKDIDKRFRWDLSYAAKLAPWVCDNLYSYMNDDHIDTALKNIVKDLEL